MGLGIGSERLRGELAAVETLGVAFWAGAAAGYAFLAAPTVAHQANDLDLQARITGTVLGRTSLSGSGE